MAEKTIDQKLDGLSEHLNKLHQRFDAIEEERKTDRARLDAMEATENERAAKARKDAALPTNPADEERERMDREAGVQAQMRADSAFQAWNLGQAPHRVHGESVRDFRIRLLRPLKQYSRAYANSSLETIGDESAFSNIESTIINDAVQASMTTVVPGAPLRKTTTMNEMGHRVTRFTGDPLVTWAPYMGGSVRFGRIVRPAPK